MNLPRLFHEHCVGRRLLRILVVLLIAWPNSALIPLPGGGSLPLEYGWGETYLEVAHRLAGGGIPLLEEQEGRLLRVRRGRLEVQYLFYTKEKIGDIILTEREEEDGPRMVLERLVLEPVHSLEEARLYAVDAILPGLPLGKEGQTREKNALLARLAEIYGPASVGEAGFIEFANRDSLVRVYYTERGTERFAKRLSFQSRVIGRARNRAIRKLQAEADRRIRKEIRSANRKLKRGARSKP